MSCPGFCFVAHFSVLLCRQLREPFEVIWGGGKPLYRHSVDENAIQFTGKIMVQWKMAIDI